MAVGTDVATFVHGRDVAHAAFTNMQASESQAALLDVTDFPTPHIGDGGSRVEEDIIGTIAIVSPLLDVSASI